MNGWVLWEYQFRRPAQSLFCFLKRTYNCWLSAISFLVSYSPVKSILRQLKGFNWFQSRGSIGWATALATLSFFSSDVPPSGAIPASNSFLYPSMISPDRIDFLGCTSLQIQPKVFFFVSRPLQLLESVTWEMQQNIPRGKKYKMLESTVKCKEISCEEEIAIPVGCWRRNFFPG